MALIRKWPRPDSNWGPGDYESLALTAELQGRTPRTGVFFCGTPQTTTFRNTLLLQFGASTVISRPDSMIPFRRTSVTNRPKRKRRVPKLCFTKSQNIGFYATFRDPTSGSPRKRVFGNIDREQAEREYAKWLTEFLNNEPQAIRPKRSGQRRSSNRRVAVQTAIEPGSLAQIADDFLTNVISAQERSDGDQRQRGTISRSTAAAHRRHTHDFLKFLNSRHGHAAIAWLQLSDIEMRDVEEYNRTLARDRGLSASEVSKRMQIVKRLIDRAGRPEHGSQVLTWNWNGRDKTYGRSKQQQRLPSLAQLQAVLRESDARGQALVWTAIGLGMGPTDLSQLRLVHIDRESYDLRRSKTGIDRFGETPPLVWAYLKWHTTMENRQLDDLVFTTRSGHPLVHGKTNAISLWWNKLRSRLGESNATLGGFYTLRHLGATEFGSRPGASIGEVKRWLGHSASSTIADHYMKPVSPEYRPVVMWVRQRLQSDQLD